MSKLFPLLSFGGGGKDASLLWNTFLVSAEDFSVKKNNSFVDCFEDNPLKSGWDNRRLGWILQEHRGCECAAHPPADRKSLQSPVPAFGVRQDGQPGQPSEELRLPAQVPAGWRQRRGQRRDPGQPAGRLGRVPIRLQQR